MAKRSEVRECVVCHVSCVVCVVAGLKVETRREGRQPCAGLILPTGAWMRPAWGSTAPELHCRVQLCGGRVGPGNPPPNSIWAVGGGTKHQPTAQTARRKASIRLEAVNATVEPCCWDGTGQVREGRGRGQPAAQYLQYTPHHFDDDNHDIHHHQVQPLRWAAAPSQRQGHLVQASTSCDRSFPFEPLRILPLERAPLGTSPLAPISTGTLDPECACATPSDPAERLHLALQLDLSLAHRGTNRRLTSLPVQWLAPSSSYCTGPDQYLRPGLFCIAALVCILFLFLFAFPIYYADNALTSRR